RKELAAVSVQPDIAEGGAQVDARALTSLFIDTETKGQIIRSRSVFTGEDGEIIFSIDLLHLIIHVVEAAHAIDADQVDFKLFAIKRFAFLLADQAPHKHWVDPAHGFNSDGVDCPDLFPLVLLSGLPLGVGFRAYGKIAQVVYARFRSRATEIGSFPVAGKFSCREITQLRREIEIVRAETGDGVSHILLGEDADHLYGHTEQRRHFACGFEWGSHVDGDNPVRVAQLTANLHRYVVHQSAIDQLCAFVFHRCHKARH